ncbi:DnaJ domain-containing protein [Nemania sp. FL0031]|nr:DnaJ domain-containing protein [Nemania sp. FL0031]
MISDKPDYWDILGVTRGASSEELQAAYRRLALKHHPDKNKGNEESATEKFQEVQKAFEALRGLEKPLVQDISRGASSLAKATTSTSTKYGCDPTFSWFDQNWGPNFGRRRNGEAWGKAGTTDWFEETGRKPMTSSFTPQHPGFGVFSRFFTHLPPLPPRDLRLEHHRHNCDWRESRRIISIRVFA